LSVLYRENKEAFVVQKIECSLAERVNGKNLHKKRMEEPQMKQNNDTARELSKILAAECASTQDVATLLKTLFAGTLEQMLEAEMAEHLGYSKNSVEGNNTGNSRNGYGKKTIKSEWGENEI